MKDSNVIISHYLTHADQSIWTLAYAFGSGTALEISSKEAYQYIINNDLRSCKTIINSVSIKTIYTQQ